MCDGIRYFVTFTPPNRPRQEWEVSRAEYVSQERQSGFRPKGVDVGQPATGSFSSGAAGGFTTYGHCEDGCEEDRGANAAL